MTSVPHSDKDNGNVKIIVTFPTGGDMLKLPPVSRSSDGVEQIKVFLKAEEREQLRQMCQENGITMTHLARQLLVAWASVQNDNESQAS